MKLRTPAVRVGLLLIGSLLATSCQSGKQSASASMFSSPATRASQDVANDYSKPYLTEEKMQQFLASMKEEHNPLELVFKQGGQMQNPASLGDRLEEFNSFARKYGFQDFQDYTGVWGRVQVGEMQIWGAVEFEDMISGAQKELKKPDLVPEMRKVYEEQIANAQKSLDDMNKSNSGSAVNAADMALIKKYKDQIDAAEKKHKTGK